MVRDAQIIFAGPIAGDTVYQPGDDAALKLTIVNEGDRADRLVRVTSPIASSVTITGDTWIPGHQVLSVGYPTPPAPRGTDAVQIVLTGLNSPVSAGFSYPVVLAFEQAELRLELPVENPTRLH